MNLSDCIFIPTDEDEEMEAMSNHSSPTQFTHNCNTMHIKYIKI